MSAKRKRRGIKRRRRGCALMLLLMAVICAAVFACVSIFFNVDTIKVTGDTRYTTEQVIEASGIRQKQNIFMVSERAAHKKIIAACPYIENVKLVRHLPNTVELRVTESSEVYACINDSGVVTMVNAQGMVMEQSGALPKYTCLLLGFDFSGYTPGEKLPDDWNTAFETIGDVLKAFDEAGMKDQIGYIRASDPLNIQVMYAGRILLYLGSNYDLDTKLKTAKTVMDSQLAADYTGYINVAVSGRAFAKAMPLSQLADAQYLAIAATPT